MYDIPVCIHAYKHTYTFHAEILESNRFPYSCRYMRKACACIAAPAQRMYADTPMNTCTRNQLYLAVVVAAVEFRDVVMFAHCMYVDLAFHTRLTPLNVSLTLAHALKVYACIHVCMFCTSDYVCMYVCMHACQLPSL